MGVVDEEAFSFQPTYEELKPVTFKDCWRFRSFCFQPTYEELKRDMVIPNRYMQIQFSAYLWGIETSIRINSYTQTQVQFSAYLWGIETSEGGKHESF